MHKRIGLFRTWRSVHTPPSPHPPLPKHTKGGSSPTILFVDGAWSEACADCPQLSQGQVATYTLIPTSSHTPVKITLAYYDYPASSATTSRALVNNLDLTASHMGLNYSANGASSPSAVVNTRNNLEQIVIPNPTVGQPVVVRVAGTSVVRGPQPYALAITGRFRKDATLFPQAVPRVDAFATDGTEVCVRVCMSMFSFMRESIGRACIRPPLTNTHDTTPHLLQNRPSSPAPTSPAPPPSPNPSPWPACPTRRSPPT